MTKNKNRSLLGRLMNTYAMTLIIVILLFSFLVSYATTKSDSIAVDNQLEQTSKTISRTINDYQTVLRRMMVELYPNQIKINSMIDYFYMSLADYYTQQLALDQFQLFPRDIEKLYTQYDNVEGIIITLDATGDIYYSQKSNKMGKKLEQLPNISNYMVFNRKIINYDTYTPVGNFYVLVDYNTIDTMIDQHQKHVEPIIFLLSDTGNIKYEHNIDKAGDLHEHIIKKNQERKPLELNKFSKYTIDEVILEDGSHLIVGARKFDIFLKSMDAFALTFLGGGVLIGILLIALFKMFGRYDNQVNDILGTMDRVQVGNIADRVNLGGKEGELLLISKAINETLDSTSKYIKQIYQLELSQQEINMRALQSQINPHFLYNTLEYIRMYAVTEGVDELADIVYAFSSLLRNNISLEKTTTLSKELTFVEQYVYLFQMRYPNKIAYKFEVNEDFRQHIIPKFTLQPLIENYFMHGVDYRRIDNAIKVTVEKEGGRVSIIVSDNGKGVSDEKLQSLKERLENSNHTIESGNSVGLFNVYERLKVYYRDQDFTFNVDHSDNGGFKVTISFREEIYEI